MMKYILERYHPEIGNWGDVAEPEVNDSVHCGRVRYRGDVITPIESENERIKEYDANEKVCFAAFVTLNDVVCDLPNADQRYDDIIEAITTVNYGRRPQRFMGEVIYGD